MAPPNRYTNITSRATGSTSDVTRASALRQPMRRHRLIMTTARAGPEATATGRAGPDAGRARTTSDFAGLHFFTGGLAAGAGPARQGQEHRVEADVVHGEPAYRGSVRIDLVQQRAHGRPFTARRDVYEQRVAVGPGGPGPEPPEHRGEGHIVGELESELALADPPLERRRTVIGHDD